eukprot:scaffold7335_cov88-Skeletonema_marinoi.AAC.1
MKFTFASSVISLLASASPQNCAAIQCFARDGVALKQAADKYVAGTWTTADNDEYGPITSWCTREVTNMLGLFANATQFNADLSSWNVSSVADMNSMFYGARQFNADLSGWNVSSVTIMSGMFYGASAFDSELSLWDVSSVTHMDG